MVTLISPENGSQISILSDIQKEFIRREKPLKEFVPDSDSSKAYPWYSEEKMSHPGISAPASLIFKWKNSDASALTRFELSLSPDFNDEKRLGKIATVGDVFYSAEDDCHFTVVTNLLSGTTYYWRVSTATETGEVRAFSTNRGEIRTIGGGGFDNMRDIGGRITADGRRIKQGLIYRGSALNSLLTPECQGMNGLRVMRDDLAIKTDIDLRWEAVGKYEFCPLGDHVKYRLFTMEAYAGILNDGQEELMKNIFELFADEDNYPIFFHCVAGADRTGTVAFLLDALLGMSEEDIILNYNLTSICDARSWYHLESIAKLVEELSLKYPGLSLPELLVMYLRSTGLSEETLERIRSNLLE